MRPATARLRASGIRVGYRDRDVLRGVDVEALDGGFTAVIGPNACGKSTLLRTLARILTPGSGQVLLDGEDIAGVPARRLATRLAMLPQSATAPEGITVADLVARGRSPHQGLFRQWSGADESVTREALRATGTLDLATRPVAELSGGQRQRVWLAMALAQDTDLLLLDEPTTFLDVTHQIEVLNLCRALHAQRGKTVVAVLHDVNLAARYADRFVVLSEGRVVVQGPPAEVVTAGLMADVFGLAARVIPDPATGTPLVIPDAPPAFRPVGTGLEPDASARQTSGATP